MGPPSHILGGRGRRKGEGGRGINYYRHNGGVSFLGTLLTACVGGASVEVGEGASVEVGGSSFFKKTPNC